MGEIRVPLATIRHEREQVPAETNTFRRHHEDTIRLDGFRAQNWHFANLRSARWLFLAN